MMAPIALILALSGFVVYRYRETRAMTLAQFFEMRYSRNFRIFAGILAWLSGILNYGIFPAVTARFLIYFCGLPLEFEFLGMAVQTFPVMMIILLGIAVFMTLAGGHIAIMVADFLQGQFVGSDAGHHPHPHLQVFPAHRSQIPERSRRANEGSVVLRLKQCFSLWDGSLAWSKPVWGRAQTGCSSARFSIKPVVHILDPFRMPECIVRVPEIG
jgi:hypothetical protein